MDNFFGIRLLVIIILVITLASSILSATSTQTLLSPMILFLVPLALDYYTHDPKKQSDQKRKTLGIWIPAIVSAVLIAILLTQFNLDFLTDNKLIKTLLWAPYISFIIMAGIDWVAYSNKQESEGRDIIKRMSRAEVFDTPQKRVREYANEKRRNS